MDSKSPTRDYLLKPAAVAGIVAAGSAVWRPGAHVVVPGLGAPIPLPLFAAGASFVASEACALINQYLFPHIPVINAFEALAHTALNVGVLAAGSALLEDRLSPGLLQDIGLTEMAALALLAEISSSYLVDDWIVPLMAKYY